MTRIGGSELESMWARYKRDAEPGDRERLIIYYAPLVKYVASRLAAGLPSSVDRSDLTCCGMFGLMDAIDKFDLDRGYKFESYAVGRIKGAILDELRSSDWVPRTVRAKATRVEHAIATLQARLRRAPTDDEIASEMGVTRDALDAIFTQISTTGLLALDELLSLSAGSANATTLGESLASHTPGPDEAYEQNETRQLLGTAINRMPEREKIVLALYYYERMTLSQIAAVLGVTESRVCQIRTKAVLHLRLLLRAEERELV